MNFIVLASGRGSRLNRITINKPKCLTKVIKNKTSESRRSCTSGYDVALPENMHAFNYALIRYQIYELSQFLYIDVSSRIQDPDLQISFIIHNE